MATWRDHIKDATAVADRYLTSGGSIYDLRDSLKQRYPRLSSRDVDQLMDKITAGRQGARDAAFDTPGDRLRVSGLPSIAGRGEQIPGVACRYLIYARGSWIDESGKPVWGSVIILPFDTPPTQAEIDARVQAAQEVSEGRTGDTLPSALQGVTTFQGAKVVSAFKCR